MSDKVLMLGNEAFARGAYEAGCKVSAAYPGTPSTEISEAIVKYDEIYSEWSPNEKVALEVAIGASISGVRALASMKHVGLNVAADPLFTASYTGVNGGLVVIVADDPGLYSSQNEQDTRAIARAAKIPVLEPADSQEAKEFVKFAFELSEKYDTPVIVRSTTRLSHSQGLVELNERLDIEDKPYVRDIAKY
ncbi:MAG TPA: indolepyruvate ferredoxin oxidoreductase subunit alpha, partial [Mobilitalea sp.]|nr:indolepyruvate ferredoxin oxidoreductase subunit alpha [Mobilitalea sp.]